MIKKYGAVLLFAIVAVVIVAVIHFSKHKAPTIVGPTAAQQYPVVEGVQKLLVVEPKTQAPGRTISVLFTGNSLTVANNLPTMLARIAGSDTASPIRLEIQSDARSGKSLADVWRDGALLPLFGSRKWDQVVLQEDNFWVGNTDRTEQLYREVNVLATAVRNAGAKPVLFMPWIRQPGSKWYGKGSDFQNPEYMQQSIDFYVQDAAKKSGDIPVIGVGDYWALCNRAYPKIQLYAPNGSDPSMAGTYLTGLLFYRYLTGRDLSGVTLTPPTLTVDDAAALRAIAAK